MNMKNIIYMTIQKLAGIIMLILGWISMEMSDDATALVLIAMFAIPIILTKEKVLMIEIGDDENDE